MKDWEISAVVCEGAPAVKVTKKGHFYIAKYNKQDLVNITPGEEVPFTVTVILEHRGHRDHHSHYQHYGHQIAFEGRDTLRVIE